MADSRLDILVSRRFGVSRSFAREAIQKGLVLRESTVLHKPGEKLPENTPLELLSLPWFVSRGGLKLQAALEQFAIDAAGKICLDIGASTGGFTDCLLQRGAAKVFAVENGPCQLAERLLADSRVVSLERTDARTLRPEMLDEAVQLAAVDVSFISLTKVIAPVMGCLAADGEAICLIKPQFEAGPGLVPKTGVIKDVRVHRRVLRQVLEFLVAEGLLIKGLMASPIEGGEGNREFLCWVGKMGKGMERGCEPKNSCVDTCQQNITLHNTSNSSYLNVK